jgi:hypothetical protein
MCFTFQYACDVTVLYAVTTVHRIRHFTDTIKSLQNGIWFKWKHAFIEKIVHGKRTVIISVKLLK